MTPPTPFTRRLRHQLLLVVSTLLLWAHPTDAQSAPPSLHSLSHLSVTQRGIAPAHSSLDVLAPAQVTPGISVQKQERRVRRYVLGALIGGGIGALAGLGLYELHGCEVEEPPRGPCEGFCFYTSECSPSKGASMGVGALIGGVLGLIAAAVGS